MCHGETKSGSNAWDAPCARFSGAPAGCAPAGGDLRELLGPLPNRSMTFLKGKYWFFPMPGIPALGILCDPMSEFEVHVVIAETC